MISAKILSPGMLYKIASFLALIFSKIVFRLEIKGRENIPKAGGFILASNHASYLDPAVLAAACPRRLDFMARHDLFSIPLFGLIIRALGAFPLKRGTADISSIKQALKRLRAERGLLVFPEGSRSVDGSNQKAEPGVAFVAAKSKAAVIPTFIRGSNIAFGRNARFVRPVKISIYFGKPVYAPDNASRNHYAGFAEEIMQDIKQLGASAR